MRNSIAIHKIIFNQDDLNAINAGKDPKKIADIIEILKRAKIVLTESDYAMLSQRKCHQALQTLKDMLVELRQLKILSQDSFDVVKEHNDPSSVIPILYLLMESKISLSPDDFVAIGNHQNLIALEKSLFILRKNGCLTRDGFDMIMMHPDLENLNLEKKLEKLKEAQENRDFSVRGASSTFVALLSLSFFLNSQAKGYTLAATDDSAEEIGCVAPWSEKASIECKFIFTLLGIKEQESYVRAVSFLSELARRPGLSEDLINAAKETPLFSFAV